MNLKRPLWCIVFLFCGLMVSGQVVQSEKAFLKVEKEKPEVELIPEITIHSPVLDKRSRFETSDPEIPLFGNVSNVSGIESVVVNSEFVDFTGEGHFTRRLELYPGDNIVVVGVLIKNNKYTEKRFTVIYTPVKISLAEKIQQEATYYALIIAINNYSDPALSSLENPIKDAERLYDVLTSNYTFDKDNIQFLKDARREEIIYALENLSKRVTPNDNLLIFYAGHGKFDFDANIGYWLPSNARRISSSDWFGNSQLVDFMKQIDSRHTLLITDACFSGSIFTARSAFADAPLAIEKLYELPSRKAMTSGTLDEVPDQSTFANYLVDRLSSNRDKYYGAHQLFSSLRNAVINNSDCIPQYGEIRNVGDQGGDFIFIRK